MDHIYAQFQFDGQVISCTRYGSGHINETYLVVTNQPHLYILQKLSTQAFKDVPGLMENVIAVTAYLGQQNPDPRRGEPNEKERICGTWQFDEYPTYDEWISWVDMDVARPERGKLEKYHESHLPIWAKGNVYLGGAKPWQHEKDCLVLPDMPELTLVDSEDGPKLQTNVYDLIAAYRAAIVDSDVLGCAFEPEQRFENPDGTEIIFDRDYFGGHRGTSAIPGPFATAEDAGKIL